MVTALSISRRGIGLIQKYEIICICHIWGSLVNITLKEHWSYLSANSGMGGGVGKKHNFLHKIRALWMQMYFNKHKISHNKMQTAEPVVTASSISRPGIELIPNYNLICIHCIWSSLENKIKKKTLELSKCECQN